MIGKFLLGQNKSSLESNIYADKSSIVLSWLLQKGINKENFSLREVANDTAVSVGLVQKVFETLVFQGILQTKGLRTSKRFVMKKPTILLKNWIEQYSIVKKCKKWTYRSSQNREEILKTLQGSNLISKTALALHSAAQIYGCKNTNLDTLELYMLEPGIKENLEKLLVLEPQERGYEVLLIEPYYKSWLKLEMEEHQGMHVAPVLLTFLDLYHFPLRGLEQTEFMVRQIPALKQIYEKR